MSNITECNAESVQSCFDAQSDVCGRQTDYIDFVQLYYCGLGQNFITTAIMSVAFIAFIFNFISTTADTYLAPSLESLSKKLKLSEAVAGVTLLAFANGATDVVAGIVAGGKETGGITIAIGGLFGACLFTVTVVLARCIQGGGDIRTDDRGVKRDVIFLIIGTLYFIFLTFIQHITWFWASGFFVIYAVFILYVIHTERIRSARRASALEKMSRVRSRLLSKTAKNIDMTESVHADDEVRRERVSSAWDQVLMPYLMKSLIHKRTQHGLNTDFSDPKLTDSLLQGDLTKDLDYVKEEADKQENEEEEDNSLQGRILRVYNIPLLFVRNLTMPPFEEENWNVYYATASPIFGGLFFLWQTNLISFFEIHPTLWVLFATVALALSFYIFKNGRSSDFAETHEGLFATVTFIMSALWLNLIVACFMDLLSLFTVASGFPLNFLSLTLLAWGNSMDDFFVDYVIAKAGNGRMAVAGVYGGQLFNMLVGFGGALVMQTFQGSKDILIYNFTGDDGKQNVLTVILLLTLLLVLISTLIFGSSKRWVFGRSMMILLMTAYAAFLLIVSFITFV